MASACSHGGIYSVDHRLVRVDCSSSVNPLGAPKKAITVIKNGASSLAPLYPDPECRDLKKSLARHLETDISRITVGNGAVEIIHWFAQAFAKRRVVIPAPTFCEYELASQRAGAHVMFVPLAPDFSLGASTVIDAAKGADAVFLCNPNNPTGLLATGEIKKIIKNADSSTRILLDECFIELADGTTDTLVKMAPDHDNLVVLRSLTKSHGLAGLRLGYSVSSPEVTEKLSAFRVPWNVNGLAQAAGVAAISDRAHLTKTVRFVKKEKTFLYNKIKKMRSFAPLASDANYFLVKLNGRNSTEFRDALLIKSGVLVRDCSTFTGMGSQHVRIAVKTHRENLILQKALERMDDGKAS
ncbi:histidinol-phosphate transaminase [Nitrososphaera sp.]|uniref:pyridoxal phosphate-dependent aminotransferase n=1 Tax=Nitrososphaera sp. TaxID=1971748 RepID=UPI002ED9E93F